MTTGPSPASRAERGSPVEGAVLLSRYPQTGALHHARVDVRLDGFMQLCRVVGVIWGCSTRML